MFHFIFILFLLVIIIPLLFVFGIALKLWNNITGKNNAFNRFGTNGFGKNGFGGNGSNRQDRTHQAGYETNGSRRGSTSSSNQGSNYGHGKIFKEGEGEYVDFEEVD